MMKFPLAAAAGILYATIGCKAQSPSDIVTFTGMCDASAATAIDDKHLVIGDDEDNILRIYSLAGGSPVYQKEISEFLGTMGKKQPKEADMEGAAKLGSSIFWITSHGRNKKGKERAERQRLFATDVKVVNGEFKIEPKGKPYSNLLDDLVADPMLQKYGFKDASELAPKESGALNIEGLAATPENTLLIGFRNPLYEGKALVISLLNPEDVIRGKKAKLGNVKTLDLGGLGIRSLGYYEGRYLIIGGPIDGGGEAALFEWDGADELTLIHEVSFAGLNPEGVSFHQANGKNEYFVLSDYGNATIDGMPCKDLEDSASKQLRGQTIRR